MQDKTLQIKYVIEERIGLVETIKQGELAKMQLEETNVKLKRLMEEYLEEED